MRIFKSVILAVPVYFLWNFLAPLYFAGLPEQYLNVPFWHIAGVFILINLIRRALFPGWRSHAFRFGHGFGQGLGHSFGHGMKRVWGCRFRRHAQHGCHLTQQYYHNS